MITDVPRTMLADLARKLERGDLEVCEERSRDDGRYIREYIPALSLPELDAIVDALRRAAS
jgi:hypothetical protein